MADRQRGLFYDSSIAYLHRILPSDVRGGLPAIGQRWAGFGEEDVDARELVLGAFDANAMQAAFSHARQPRKRGQFREFLQSLGHRSTRPGLYFEHSVLPHSPWAFLPSGRQYGDDVPVEGIEETGLRWRAENLLVAQALQRHLLQVGYVDRLIGHLIDRLKRVGLYDKSIVIVTADHGANFEPKEYMREIDRASLPDVAGVPSS